jgi:hypothetical protein
MQQPWQQKKQPVSTAALSSPTRQVGFNPQVAAAKYSTAASASEGIQALPTQDIRKPALIATTTDDSRQQEITPDPIPFIPTFAQQPMSSGVRREEMMIWDSQKQPSVFQPQKVIARSPAEDPWDVQDRVLRYRVRGVSAVDMIYKIPPGLRNGRRAFCGVCLSPVDEQVGTVTLWGTCPCKSRYSTAEHERGLPVVVSANGTKDDVLVQLVNRIVREGPSQRRATPEVHKIFHPHATVSSYGRILSNGNITVMYFQDWRILIDETTPEPAGNTLIETLKKQAEREITRAGGLIGSAIVAMNYQTEGYEEEQQRFRLPPGVKPHPLRRAITQKAAETFLNRPGRTPADKAGLNGLIKLQQRVDQNGEYPMLDDENFMDNDLTMRTQGMEESWPEQGMTTPDVKHVYQLMQEARETGWPCALKGPAAVLEEIVHDRRKGIKGGVMIVYNQLNIFDDIGYYVKTKQINIMDITNTPGFRTIMKNEAAYIAAGGASKFEVTIQQVREAQPSMAADPRQAEEVATLKYAHNVIVKLHHPKYHDGRYFRPVEFTATTILKMINEIQDAVFRLMFRNAYAFEHAANIDAGLDTFSMRIACAIGASYHEGRVRRSNWTVQNESGPVIDLIRTHVCHKAGDIHQISTSATAKKQWRVVLKGKSVMGKHDTRIDQACKYIKERMEPRHDDPERDQKFEQMMLDLERRQQDEHELNQARAKKRQEILAQRAMGVEQLPITVECISDSDEMEEQQPERNKEIQEQNPRQLPGLAGEDEPMDTMEADEFDTAPIIGGQSLGARARQSFKNLVGTRQSATGSYEIMTSAGRGRQISGEAIEPLPGLDDPL